MRQVLLSSRGFGMPKTHAQEFFDQALARTPALHQLMKPPVVGVSEILPAQILTMLSRGLD